ncbi:hypothetical protein V6O07_00870, partial [Arthrospira platensis SPKY2]
MRKIRINPSGDILLPDIIQENHFSEMEKYHMSNYIDFTSGNLIDKKFNISCVNQKVNSRDTFMISTSKSMGLNPFLSDSIIISDYIENGVYTDLKVAVTYKIKINNTLSNNNNANLNFGLCAKNNDGTIIKWCTIGKVGNINDSKLYEGVIYGVIPINDAIDRIIPWFQVDEPASTSACDIDIIYANYELMTDTGAESRHNKLIYKIQSIEIEMNGYEDTTNHDIMSLEIELADGSIVTERGILECKFNGENCTIPIGRNIFTTNKIGKLYIRFKSVLDVANIRFQHSNLKHYHEKIGLGYDDIQDWYIIYDSYAKPPFESAKKLFNYYSTTLVDMNMQTRCFSIDGLEFSHIGNQFASYRKLSFFQCNMETVGDERQISEPFIMKFKPNESKNTAYITSNNIPTGGLGGHYKASAWVRVSEDCDTDKHVYLGFKNPENSAQNLTITYYDMKRKGEWQLLSTTILRSQVTPVIYVWIPFANNRWTKGTIEVSSSINVCYIRANDFLPKKIFMGQNGILSLNTNIVKNKTIYIETILQSVDTEDNKPVLIAYGEINNKILIYQETNGLSIVRNGTTLATKILNTDGIIPTKILINKNGNIYINGEKVVNGANLPINITYCSMGYDLHSSYSNSTTPYAGTLKKIISFYDEFNDIDCINITKTKNISLPLNYVNEFIEKPNKPLEDYKKYYFPLTYDYHNM